MKKLITTIALLVAIPASAFTWTQYGTLYGNICRKGYFYTVYPLHMGQPVGTSCPVRDNMGTIIGFGVVTAE